MSNKSYPFWKVSSHTFILGAGASRAAFPNGDKNGRRLPLMNDFIDIVGLKDLLNSNNINYSVQNIEEIYDDIYTKNPDSPLLEAINDRIINYFSILQIPDEVTLYDELILSLQKKDVIFSFNWDTLLLQAYNRNHIIKELPKLYFLHGNVLAGVCEKDKRSGFLGNKCSVCHEYLTPSQILFPIKKKDYYKDSFIKNEWNALKYYLDNSFLLTIFGYSAPTTDIEAKNIMLYAWNKNKRKELNEIKIIDTKHKRQVEKTWSEFIYNGHGGIYKNVRHTRSFLYARRSCESWGDAIMQNFPWKEIKMPRFRKLESLQKWVQPLIAEEINFREKDIPITANR